MTVTLISFGFKYGIPPADKIYDCRKLLNPHNTFTLRLLDGRDEKVQKFVAGDPKFTELMYRVSNDIEDGKTYAFGCHGGRHRSVAIVEMIARELEAKEMIGIIRHTQLGNRDTVIRPWGINRVA